MKLVGIIEFFLFLMCYLKVVGYDKSKRVRRPFYFIEEFFSIEYVVREINIEIQ
jgi:hypothetical protein